MPRLLFEKTGNAVWISHLDLMRLFQRAFKRAGLPLTHSQGFTPRAQVAIALPLSVGVESRCELLDFELDEAMPSAKDFLENLNRVLIPGVQVLDVYETGRKIRDLALLDCTVTMTYDRGIPTGCKDGIQTLFRQPQLMVEKRGKSGVQEQDIIPMIRSLEVTEMDGRNLTLHARICCQNPALNPAQLVGAIARHLPEFTPDHSTVRREEIYDANNTIFR